MARLKWENRDSGLYQQGVSHGVFYGEDGVGHAWSGLISVTEKPQTNAPTPVYNSLGEKYDIFGNIAEKKHGLSCYTYPEAMEDYLGTEYLDEFGFRVDERPPKKFHMAYRVELGNGLYELHILLNQIATFGETSRSTVTNTPALTTITMNLEGVPDPRIKTSHIVLDSRLPLTESAETLLFGDRYTEPNINTFLTAQPVWETVATNYAPIIEPDYDNMVWLGAENLFDPANYSHHSNVGYATSQNMTSAVIEVEPNTTYTISILNKQSNRFGVYQDDLGPTIHEGYIDKTSLIYADFLPTKKGSNVIQTVTTRDASYGKYMIIYLSNEGGYERSDLIKVELGDRATPWVPHKNDPDQKPRPLDPYPENYKPGVKRLSTSMNTPSSSSLAYYDERTRGIGVYSNRDIHNTSALFLYMYYISIGTVVDAYYKVHVRNIAGPITGSYFGRMLLADRWVWGPVPNKPGTTEGSIKGHMFENNPRAVLWNGAPSGTAEVSFSDIVVTNAGTTSEFFDANSTPPTRGDRYVRVPGRHFDYTIHQQLRLRSTSRVTLSDITQYDFWLDAADSMLLSQNETFTFNGPQAVIDGDTFTIDDSIQGYAEG